MEINKKLTEEFKGKWVICSDWIDGSACRVKEIHSQGTYTHTIVSDANIYGSRLDECESMWKTMEFETVEVPTYNHLKALILIPSDIERLSAIYIKTPTVVSDELPQKQKSLI